MIGGALSRDCKTVYITAAHLKGEENEKEIRIRELSEEKCAAEIVYPSGLGEIELNGNALKIKLPEKRAVLIKFIGKTVG